MLHGLSLTSFSVAVSSALPSCVLVPAAEKPLIAGDTTNEKTYLILSGLFRIIFCH